MPGLSDVFGRKLIAILGFVGSAISVWLLAGIGADPTMLFVALFVVSFFCLGNVALITGPIATEAAPVGLVSSAIGIVVGSGEIFGGGVAPSIAGYIAQNYGIQNVLFVALSGVVFGGSSACSSRRPRRGCAWPRKAARRSEAPLSRARRTCGPRGARPPPSASAGEQRLHLADHVVARRRRIAHLPLGEMDREYDLIVERQHAQQPRRDLVLHDDERQDRDEVRLQDQLADHGRQRLHLEHRLRARRRRGARSSCRR